jgi:hypothetical protein
VTEYLIGKSGSLNFGEFLPTFPAAIRFLHCGYMQIHERDVQMNQTNSGGQNCGTLWTLREWARAWRISERQCHVLRKHSLFPADATVPFGPRCVRFRASSLDAFAAALALTLKPIPAPARLQRGREAARLQRDEAARWIGNSGARVA